MKPIRFNPATDLAPIPFDERICRLADIDRERQPNLYRHAIEDILQSLGGGA